MTISRALLVGALLTSGCKANQLFMPAFEDRAFSDGAFLLGTDPVHLPITGRWVSECLDDTTNDLVIGVRTGDPSLVAIECVYGPKRPSQKDNPAATEEGQQAAVEGTSPNQLTPSAHWTTWKCQASISDGAESEQRLTAISIRSTRTPAEPIPGYVCLGKCEPASNSMDRYAAFLIESAKPATGAPSTVSASVADATSFERLFGVNLSEGPADELDGSKWKVWEKAPLAHEMSWAKANNTACETLTLRRAAGGSYSFSVTKVDRTNVEEYQACIKDKKFDLADVAPAFSPVKSGSPTKEELAKHEAELNAKLPYCPSTKSWGLHSATHCTRTERIGNDFKTTTPSRGEAAFDECKKALTCSE